MKRKKLFKEKMMGTLSGVSGTMSFLGSWQVCHNLCLAIIALLSIIGISIVGMPLLFLTQYAIYFWSAAVLLLIPTLIMYWKNRACVSKNLILLNIGIVIAAIPFPSLQSYNLLFWIVGGILVLIGVHGYVRNRFRRT